jgi:hypothetical protein
MPSLATQPQRAVSAVPAADKSVRRIVLQEAAVGDRARDLRESAATMTVIKLAVPI